MFYYNPCSFKGQFWNIPVEAVKLTDPALIAMLPPDYDPDQLYLVTVKPEDSVERTFLGELFDRHWDNYQSPCLYVGNSQVSNQTQFTVCQGLWMQVNIQFYYIRTQAGPSGELKGYSDSVIEGNYAEYITSGKFEDDFTYNKFDSGKCSSGGGDDFA